MLRDICGLEDLGENAEGVECAGGVWCETEGDTGLIWGHFGRLQRFERSRTSRVVESRSRMITSWPALRKPIALARPPTPEPIMITRIFS